MARQTLTDILKKDRRKFRQKLELALEEAVEAARDFAPRGHSDQLRSGIASGGAVETANGVSGFMISSAISERGYDYAKKIHDDETLGHASPASGKATKSFVDFAKTGDDRVKRYQSGRLNFPGEAPKYATKYLERGFKVAKKNFDKAIGVVN